MTDTPRADAQHLAQKILAIRDKHARERPAMARYSVFIETPRGGRRAAADRGFCAVLRLPAVHAGMVQPDNNVHCRDAGSVRQAVSVC